MSGARASAGLFDWLAPEASRNGQRGVASGRPGYAATVVDLALITLLAIAVRAPTLSVSAFDADESAFMLAAREVLWGHLPYTTFWDHKPLGSTMFIAAAMAAFGQSVETVRVLALVCVIATAWSLRAITLRLVPDRWTALAAAVLYVAFSTRLLGLALMNEILMAPFTTFGVLLSLRALDRRGALGSGLTLAAAGLAFGLGVWVKYVPAIPATLVGGFVLVSMLFRPDGGFVRAVAYGVLFSVCLWLPTLAGAFVFWRAGALDEFLFANFGFVGGYVEAVGDSRGALVAALRRASIAVAQIWPLLALTAAALLPAAFRFFADGARRRVSTAVGLWLVAEFVALAAQTLFDPYQWLVTLPPMAVAAAVTVRVYAASFAAPSKAASASALAVGFVALVPLVPHVRETTAEVLRPDAPREVARAVRAQMAPGDTVYVANYQSIIYFLAQSPLPTRYAFPMHLTGFTPFINADPAAELRRLLEARPRFIVVNESWRIKTDVWDPEPMTRIEETLAQHYAPGESWKLHSDGGIIRLFVRRG